MKKNRESGVTLIEILVAVTLLSLLSLGVLIAMRLGLSTMDKTDARIESNRRIVGARRILESEIGGFMYSMANFVPQPLVRTQVLFLEAQPQRMRFVSSYSLEEASRGRPQVAVLQVIPAEKGEGVRLVLNETPYLGPDQTGQMITGVEHVVGQTNPVIHFSDSPASPQSFVLADRLAYCRFWYLEARPVPPLRVWRTDWVDQFHLPLGIRVDMAPLDASTTQLHETSLTLPLMVSHGQETFIRMRMTSRRGSALLTVLWLSAALAAIGLAVANNVRGETERTETGVDDAKAYFAARGAVERAALHMLWVGYRTPDGQPIYFTQGQPVMMLDFPGALVRVEVIPEASKLNLNGTRPEEMLRLLVALGVEPQMATDLTEAIVDWRTPANPLQASPFDAFYQLQTPSFSARHASFQENEELLLVKGMTPDLYYGAALGATHAGLRDCVSVYGSAGAVDVNTAQPAVLETIGISAADTETLVGSRATHPVLNAQDFRNIVQELGPAGARLRIGGTTMYTLRAMARLKQSNGKLSDLERGVEALVKFNVPGSAATNNGAPAYEILRWYDRS